MQDDGRAGILAQQHGAAVRPARRLRAMHALAIALGLTGVAAFGIAPESTLDLPPARTVERALPLPPFVASEPDASPYWREERVQRGDTIGSLLARAGVDDPRAMAFLRTDAAARPLYQLRPGQPVRVAVDDEGRLAALRVRSSGGDVVAVERAGDGFATATAPAAESVRLTLASGTIATSLFGAADAAGIPDAVTMALAELFGGDIDFLQDLRRGDRFAALYETRMVDGEPVGTGRIVAAEFENRGRRYTAFHWHDADGRDAWYTSEGHSTRKAFLRSPMEFSRMTSGFSLARLHPIFQTRRAHKGVDYAAPAGTPVRATADGVVTLAGTSGGYGLTVDLRHAGAYSTLYAHLSRIAPQVRNGARVRQGEVIGYVGATGWATGPHLHYEFRVNGEARNPLAVALPTAGPLPPETRAAFHAHAAPLEQQLALAREVAGTRVAARD
ncbi:MAG: peptidoglycan DD-metalloendopeptidase family protein [Betaproteobacteria bacterium]|nr:peptidoglycan DD-metalloendopeptidase family protein [Betaproteobacteria bacterium]